MLCFSGVVPTMTTAKMNSAVLGLAHGSRVADNVGKNAGASMQLPNFGRNTYRGGAQIAVANTMPDKCCSAIAVRPAFNLLPNARNAATLTFLLHA